MPDMTNLRDMVARQPAEDRLASLQKPTDTAQYDIRNAARQLTAMIIAVAFRECKQRRDN
jgi:hypothetical protein